MKRRYNRRHDAMLSRQANPQVGEISPAMLAGYGSTSCPLFPLVSYRVGVALDVAKFTTDLLRGHYS